MDEQGNWLQAQKLNLGRKGPLDINHVVFSRQLYSMEIAEPLTYTSDGDSWPYGSEAVPEKGRERRQERRWLAAHKGGLPTRNPDGEVEHIPHEPPRT
eukprot:1629231-Pyramimonas_sp.AAC.1